MIATTPPSKRVLELLSPRMADLGYSYKKTWHRFIKPFAHGTLEFWTSFDGRGGLLSVDGGFFVHFSKLETLCEKALGEKRSWTVGASFGNARVKPRSYDVFVSEYAALTPKEKALIDPELVHPQERVEGAVAFLLDAHERYALPLFGKVPTYSQLLDFLLDGLRGNEETYRYFYIGPDTLAMAMLLMGALGKEPGELYGIADAYDTRCAAPRARSQLEKAAKFLESASAEELMLE